ncbi:hypothetical protein DAPPUDRAFT_238738 [Daphnia pulex]|uniref:Uncharacterized protein n=1 Tax=Daphnia pulex TaxID=6669 RepID=E9G797_DAPPU|nr:hypothetical protein DAPPUDRAFT_238738 [Daphnia pulex]|eukprot:EFX84430.1 hypothetical protein DAPPUDRAFT_238738 [Daphnia pulex]
MYCGIKATQLKDRARSFFMEWCGPGTDILVPMLTFVHDRRRTSTNVLLQTYLCDACSSSFTASKHNLFDFTGDFASFWTTSVITSVRCYTPAVTHHRIMPSLVALNSVCALYCDVRQLLAYIKDVHGGIFRRVLLSGLLDSAARWNNRKTLRPKTVAISRDDCGGVPPVTFFVVDETTSEKNRKGKKNASLLIFPAAVVP